MGSGHEYSQLGNSSETGAWSLACNLDFLKFITVIDSELSDQLSFRRAADWATGIGQRLILGGGVGILGQLVQRQREPDEMSLAVEEAAALDKECLVFLIDKR